MFQIPFKINIKDYDKVNFLFNVEYIPEDKTLFPITLNIRIEPDLVKTSEQVIQNLKNASPQQFWQDMLASKTHNHDVYVSLIGKTHVFPTSNPIEISASDELFNVRQQKLFELSSWRYSKEASGVTYDGYRFKTDRDSQAAIYRAISLLKSQVVSEIDWKTSDGEWTKLNLTKAENLAETISIHVQNCFKSEKLLSEEIKKLTTIEQIVAFQFPDILI